MKKNNTKQFAPPGFSIQEVEDFWDEVIELYDSSNEKIGYGHVQRFLHGLKYFQSPPNSRILNIWSRIGEAVPYMLERFPQGQFVHCEVSGKMISRAKQRFPDQDFRKTDLTNLELDDESFDAILSLETLEHCPNPFQFCCELFRVLRPSGEMVMSCPPALSEPMLQVYELFFENHGEGPHKFLWSRKVKKMLRAAGFELLEHRGTVFLPVIPDCLAWLDKLIAKILGRTPLGELGIRQFYHCRKP